MNTTESVSPLFPPLQPYRSGMLVVDDLHTLYWEECGNPVGVPVLFLHGGPGGGITPMHRQFFDPAYYRIVLFDQRGSGQSTPLGEVRDNTTPLLIADIEALRRMLDVKQWLVFGGSWGATLALAYGQAHPQSCLGFILRGIFLCTRAEIDWFLYGMRVTFPEAHDEFIAAIPAEERTDLLRAYERRLFGSDVELATQTARNWSRYEGSCLFLQPQPEIIDVFGDDTVALGIGRLEAHYFLHQGFMAEDQLIRDIERIRHLPAVIVQGRYDAVCPPISAYRLHQAWPQAKLHIIGDAGHAAMEPGTAAALVAATEQFRMQQFFN
ncbi:prolyl aminopeptidase [Herminiimonas fonticola]|uniref:Proline iminopeptidase n=1 Tax=Herminiimonas fonticola TaxID=303380 RepID=A0A4V3BW71_9BURK|nr:prolyl aminopeptidase [Herminiimonas fonticola]RBA24672.1 prolyl aminopeptidase [Herminiimonas fonticola]TDN93788.1 prolyl aminopeptidase [Herminiimonas fonticola]